ncbi:MAG: metallophosphoesterase [Dokdonella sp.]
MTTILHISDTHFGTEREDAVEALLRLSLELSPDLVILSGDITQRARRSEFAAALAFVKRLNAPLLSIPGNHDIPLFNLFARFLWPFAGYKRCFGDNLEPVFETPDVLVIGVNTVRRERHEDGAVDPKQIRRVAERLTQARAEQLRIVVTHQPVQITLPEDEENLLIGHDDAVREWSRAGVDLILGGHIHLPFVRPLRECHPCIERDAWIVQAGTAVSDRVRAGTDNSVHVIHRNESAQCLVERWDHTLNADAFHRVATTPVLLDR